MIVDIFGIAIVCCLIGQVANVSVLFMAVSMGIVCALYEINIHRRLKVKKNLLLMCEVICVLGYSLSLLGGKSDTYVLLSAVGIAGVLVSYNIKSRNIQISTILLLIASVCAIIPFVFVLNWLRTIIFAISFVTMALTMYFKQHDSVMV